MEFDQDDDGPANSYHQSNVQPLIMNEYAAGNASPDDTTSDDSDDD